MVKVPYRLAVQQAICAHLQGITRANGYDYDLSNAVYRGRLIFSGDSSQNPLPMLSLIESSRPDSGTWTGEALDNRMEHWSLLLQGWVDDDMGNPTDPAHYLMAAVEQRLGDIVRTRNDGSGRPSNPEIYRLGPNPSGQGTLITELTYGPGVVWPPAEQVSSKAFFYLPVRVGLAYSPGSPYIAG